MSTIQAVRMRVRFRLRDRDKKNQSFSDPEIDQATREQYVMVNSQLPHPYTSETATVTITAGANTFTVPLSGTTYANAGDVRLRLTSNGQYLIKNTREQIDAYRNGESNTTFRGVPERFALWQDASGVVQGLCYPRALVTETADLFRNLSQTVPTSATDLDSTAIMFNDEAITALAALVSADLLIGMTDEEAQKRRLSKKVADKWFSEAEKVFYHEAMRRDELVRAGQIQRWVS